jgi:aspartyl-tRNA(Asn)/glutamyl-tRNA(Gln) amidotransferase subunit A
VTPAGLPVGVQLVGPVGGDLSVLALARRLEAELTVVRGLPPAPDKGD